MTGVPFSQENQKVNKKNIIKVVEEGL
jgi:hypothetical protein